MRRNRKKYIGSLIALWCLFGLGALVLFWELAQSNAADQQGQIPAGISDTDSAGSSSIITAASDPARLIIPSVGIDANIQKVGITANGNMGVPTGKYKWQDVAWYSPGTRPGDRGNAVIDGHVDNALTLKAVFYNLNNLQIGDEVDVKDIDGTMHSFRVSDKEIYKYSDVPLAQIFGPTNGAHLNLITCYGGVWDPAIKSYDKRLVVYTELIQ